MGDDVMRKNIKEQDLYRREASERAKTLRDDVARSSSESSRIFQTLNHLAGKTKGDAADAAIRHVENVKESEAEDLEERARRAGKNQGELGKSWKERFGG